MSAVNNIKCDTSKASESVCNNKFIMNNDSSVLAQSDPLMNILGAKHPKCKNEYEELDSKHKLEIKPGLDLNNDVDSEGCRLSEKIECKGEGRQELKRKDYNFQNVPTLSEQIKNVPTLSEQIKNVPTQSERSANSRNNY